MDSELREMIDKAGERATEAIGSVAGAVADPKTAAKKVKARVGKWVVGGVVVAVVAGLVYVIRSRSSAKTKHH